MPPRSPESPWRASPSLNVPQWSPCQAQATSTLLSEPELLSELTPLKIYSILRGRKVQTLTSELMKQSEETIVPGAARACISELGLRRALINKYVATAFWSIHHLSGNAFRLIPAEGINQP